MKKIIVIFTLFIYAFSFGQDTKAKTLLDEVSQKAKSYENISIDFKYVLDNSAENIKQETRGDVVMQGNKYRLNILGATRIFDGNTLYSISPDDEEVTISSDVSNEDLMEAII